MDDAIGVEHDTFGLRIGSLDRDALRVLSFRGREGVSRLYSWEILVSTDLDSLDGVLGEPAVLTLQIAGGATRAVHGIVSRVRADGSNAEGVSRFTVRLSPKLWLLKRRRTSRIFQDQNLVSIVAAVLAGSDVEARWNLTKKYRARSYCVQYDESDYDFVTRLLAEEGIYFYFEHAPPPDGDDDLHEEEADEKESKDGDSPRAERVVFADTALVYPTLPDVADAGGGASSLSSMNRGGPAAPENSDVTDFVTLGEAPALPFRGEHEMRTADEHVHAFQWRRDIRPKAVAMKDFDFRNPNLDLQARAESRGGAVDAASLEVYEHQSDYDESDVRKDFAKMRLRQLRAREQVGIGTGNARRFTAGHRFRLEEHPTERLNREYVITDVEHVGRIPEAMAADEREGGVVYRNSFECLSAKVVARPPRRKRTLQQVLESAIVVGPAGDAIHTDALGRIRVHFHWDREQANDHSSCWIRVMQPWAEAGFGFQFIPRVGSEVLVSFLGGDEDRPVVMGGVYNATHPAPFPLPNAKTRSGIRTQTVGGAGHNEIAFEDGAGSELIDLHAQRDLTERVGHDRSLSVGGDDRIVIAGSQSVQVEGGRIHQVRGAESVSVEGAQAIRVVGAQDTVVVGKQSSIVGGVSLTTVDAAVFASKGSDSRRVEGYASLSVGLEDKETAYSVFVHGAESHEATKEVAIRSDTRIVLECGDSSLVLTPEGISLRTKKLASHSSEKMSLQAKETWLDTTEKMVVLGKEIDIFSEGGVLELDKDKAKMDANQVILGNEPDSPPDREKEDEKKETKKFHWTFFDARAPLKNKDYSFRTQGFKKRGKTDDEGLVDLEIPKWAMTADITIWTGDFPTSPRRHFAIQLGELPASASVMGAQVRLGNLGYYVGPFGDEMTPDLGVAVVHFQRDFGLEPSGTLDGPTTDKLDELHPNTQ